MKTLSMTLALCALMLAGACSNDESTSATPQTGAAEQTKQAELTPEQLGTLGAEIKKNPNDAERLLAARGLNSQSFEQAVRKVSEDPAAAKRYAESYKKAGA